MKNKINKETKNVTKNTTNKEIIVLLFPVFILLMLEGTFRVVNGWVNLLSGDPRAIVFPIILIYLIYAMFLGITKRASISTTIICVLGTILVVVNQIKMLYTGEPIYFSDINFVSNINNIFGLVQGDLISYIKPYIFYFVILIAIFSFIIIWVAKNDIKCINLKNRIILIIIPVILLTILFMPNKYTKEVFLDIFLNNKEHKDYQSYTTNISYYYSHSLLAGMYGVLLNNTFSEPQSYNEIELNSVLENTKIETKEDIGKPNIIVLFSEAFWDVDKQDNVKFDIEVMKNMKQLSKEGKLVETLSCAYGGMSENVAFELLTGGSLNYFTKGYIPVMTLYKRENADSIPSIIKELKNNNYTSKIMFGKDYYNSENTMKKIGFDEYEELTQTDDNKKGNFISDEYMIDKIIEELENKSEKQKCFIMAETIQNHMPYTLDKYEEYDLAIEESNLDEDMSDVLLSYSQGIYDANKQLNRLYEYIKEYDEPTILLFLGDHLPYLSTEQGKDLLEYIDYFNTEDELENLYRRYNTQTLILSNYNIDLNNMPNYLSNDMILTYLVNNMDLKLSTYYRWLYTTINDLPASNQYISVDVNGTKQYNQELKENMRQTYKMREYMQYKFFIKATK